MLHFVDSNTISSRIRARQDFIKPSTTPDRFQEQILSSSEKKEQTANPSKLKKRDSETKISKRKYQVKDTSLANSTFYSSNNI